MSTAETQSVITASGPAQTEAHRLLGELLGEECSAQIAPKSPVGPGALKVRIGGDPVAAAKDLEGEQWVEAVVTRPGHLYLRIETGALRRWIAGGYADGIALPLALVGSSNPARAEEEAPTSLTAFRRTAVTSALERIDPAQGSASKVAIGEVDVRYGALRMRHGGIVSVEDAAAEIARESGLDVADPPHPRTSDALTLPMLATQRAKHVHLDDEWIRWGGASLRGVARTLQEARGAEPPNGTHHRPGPDTDQEVRRLALELEALPRQAALSAIKLEPACLARFAISLAARSHAARLPDTDPLRGAVGTALETALELLGPGLPELLDPH